MKPDFTKIAYGPLTAPEAPAAPTRPTWQTAEQSRDAGVHRGGPRRPRAPALRRRPAAVPARALLGDVRTAAVDDPAVRGLLHRRGIQRLLPPQPRGRPEGPVGGLRPAHPPRVRLGQRARRRRRRKGRRGDRLGRGHEDPLRPDPARPDVGLHDHERRRPADHGVLHRRGRGAGRETRAADRDDPERHPQGVHGPQHLHLPALAVDAHHRRHLPVQLGQHAAVQLHLDQRLPHAGGRRDGGHRARLHAGRRARGTSAPGCAPGWTSTPSRPA